LIIDIPAMETILRSFFMLYISNELLFSKSGYMYIEL